MTRLTLECDHGKYTVEVPHDNLTAYDVTDDLFIPLLHAAGYHAISINEAIPDCESCTEEDDAEVGI